MNVCTALILHPKATPRPVTTIHPQSASIERHGVVLGEYYVHLYDGSFYFGEVDESGRYKLRADTKRHPQRSPRQHSSGWISGEAVARAYRLVRTLHADNPKVQGVLDEIAHRLRIANPFAER